jgi:hypothetical protein
MILTRLDLAAVPAELAVFAQALRGSGLPERVLARIAATLDHVAGEDIELADCPQSRAAAAALLRRHGLGTIESDPKSGLTWDGSAVAVGMEPSVIVHELAHFQIAPPSRRHRADFGLGAGPESGDKRRGDSERQVFGLECDHEEALASLLGILWEAEIGQPAILAFLEQNWLEGGASPRNLAHFLKICRHLARHGFIDQDGRPTGRLRECEDDSAFFAFT